MTETTASQDQAEALDGPPLAVSSAQPAEADPAAVREQWFSQMDAASEEAGYFEPVGQKHWAFFHDEGPELLVTFERLDDVMARPSKMPLGYDLAKSRGWSHLCLIADGDTWYRDKRVYGFFDRQVDDAFFEDFDRVVFMGAGIQGYAAAAYSVVAPGATVLLISPRATQFPDIAGWDKRTIRARHLDFTTRYGFAPDMIEGAGQVYVIHDPDVAEDAMHAALFRGPHVTHLRTPHLGGRVEWAFGHMQLWSPLLDAVTNGPMTKTDFARIWRARRNFGPYLRGLLAQVGAAGKTKREKWLCTGVVERLNAPTFRKRLNEILADEAEAEASAALAAVDAEETAQP